jgi:beta-glucosidase
MAERLPDDFLWGAATSAHQVEGDDPCDWSDWERRPGTISDGTRSANACEWWSGRAEDDLSLARSFGLNAIRLGVSWERIEPRPGEVDVRAIDRYRAILGHAKAIGLRTNLTLFHFALPRWLASSGGFLSATAPQALARFGRVVAQGLGDLCDLVATVNEPSVYAFMSHAGTRWPPGSGSIPAYAKALGLVLEAHARAYDAMKETRPELPVGIVLNVPAFDPAREKRRDRLVTQAQDWAFGGVVLAALEDGKARPPLALRTIPGLVKSFDWVGLNYYGRYRVRFDPKAAATLFGKHVQSPTVAHAGVDWGEIHPPGLVRGLERLGALGRPLYVTENGVRDPEDTLRRRYLCEHVLALHDARAKGLDVRGYFVWSLLDNFEWAEGWSCPFGLVALDRDTQARTSRSSAALYGEIARASGDRERVRDLLARERRP